MDNDLLKQSIISAKEQLQEHIREEVKKAKLEILEKVRSYTYNGLFLNEALNKIESEVKNNESNK